MTDHYPSPTVDKDSPDGRDADDGVAADTPAPPSIDEGDPASTDDGSGTSETD